MDKIQRIQELVKELNIHRHNYYNLNKPIISDSQYDNMIDELSALENECNYILSNSPTQTVGYEVISKLQKVEHSIPLLSLDKTKSIDELKKFIGKNDSLLMLKADGLTVEIIYENGNLIQGSTRGNGHIGEEITFNVKVFKNIPLKINWQGRLKITGEAIIHKNDFEEINSKLSDDEKYATPRNLSAGSCRQLKSEICANRNVYFYAFALLESDIEFKTKSKQFQWLESHGFNVIPYSILTSNTMVLDRSIEEMNLLAEERFIPIDGMVISYNDIKYSESLGTTNHHKLDGIAYKFLDLAETTQLTGIEWSVGRTGVITPVALFQTVILDNTEVSRASLHNLSIIEELELGINDNISIVKCNMIIPQIEENFTRSNNLEIPKVCPVCNGVAIIKQLNESKVLYCTNDNCSAKLLKRFSHFVSRDALNVDGLSEQTLEKFINQGWLKTFDDIYGLDKYKSQIVKMEGFGSRSYAKLISAIEKSKKVKLQNFIYALGIPNIGKGSSKIIAKYFKNDWFEFEEALINNFDFTVLTDFGDITNQSLHKWYDDENEKKMWIGLINIMEFVKEETKVKSNLKSLEGLTFVVTGSVETFKNRKELEELITSLSGKLSSSVSKNTTYLLNNDTASNSSKNLKAKQLGVEIISESQFNEMIGRVV